MKDRIETLKGYLKRLGNGEPLEAVRKDFVEVFKDVDPAEIMKAEQEMLAEEHRFLMCRSCVMYMPHSFMERRGGTDCECGKGSACVNTAEERRQRRGAGTDQRTSAVAVCK